MNKISIPRTIVLISSLSPSSRPFLPSSHAILLSCRNQIPSPSLAASLATSYQHHNRGAFSTTSAPRKGLPVISCGVHAGAISLGLREGLHPEYDVIHVIHSVAQAQHDLPYLQHGQAPPAFFAPPKGDSEAGAARLETEQVGSRDYSARAVAVMVGGGFDDAAFAAMRKVVEGKWAVPWLRVDKAKTVGKPGPGRAYGLQVAGRMKGRLEGLERDGLMEVDGVYMF